MARSNFLLRCLIISSILWGLNGQLLPVHATAQSPEGLVGSWRQIHVKPADLHKHQDIPEAYVLAAENDLFQLYVDETTVAFKVVDKRSGYIWSSTLDEVTKEDKLNKTWTAFARSGISIEFLDQKAIPQRASITNADHTVEMKLVEQGFEALVTFTEPSISINVIVKLVPSGVSVEVPFETIREENPDFKLGLIHVFPFFGATKEDSLPGYMFIPDGSGTLIRFAATTKAKRMFYGRYFGVDLGMTTYMPWDPMVNPPLKISIPVIGMVHGEKENAYIAIVEKGATYGEIQAHPAGVVTKFNFLYNAFVYNESFFQATNRSGAGVTTLQKSTNAFDIKIQYRFLTSDESDYVGMANSYQQYLVEKGMLKKVADDNEDIGIKVEFLGGEKEKVLFWYRSISMTTIDQMTEILKDLNIANADVVYYGWQPYGASSMPPASLSLDGSLGTLDGLKVLIKEITTKGGNFYLYLDPQAALENDESGYSSRNDLAMSITNSNLIGFNRNKVNYYLNFDVLSGRYSSLSKDVYSKLGGAGLALDGIASMVYSDFKQNHFLNREDAMLKYVELMDQNPGNTAFYLPNEYMFGYMNAYFDMPLSDSGYIYTTDVVPFLQIVLAGYVPFYGPALNFSSDLQQDLLRHVDFGVYPSYFLSYDVTAKILNTESSWIYTSSYTQWEDEIRSTYEWLNSLLSAVKGQEIVARDELEEGVVATTYANGKQIIVNYNNTQFISGNIVVNGRDAVLREVLP